MSGKRIADVEIHAGGSEESLDNDDDIDVSVDLIDERLYLGNLATARDARATERLRVTHVLTVDVVPLPRATLARPNIVFKFVKLADVTKEDLISHLPETNQFIKEALESGGTVLVHCYFGVSRSAAVVIAYIMEKYLLDYEDAFALVKGKRRFVCPNAGFVAQLRLFGHMRCTIDANDPRYKQFRLKLAGQKIKQVKILPQQFCELVRADPGVARERPPPRGLRCRRCRRLVADEANLIPHLPKEVKLELAKRGSRPSPSGLTGLQSEESGRLLMQKLNCLAGEVERLIQMADGGTAEGEAAGVVESGSRDTLEEVHDSEVLIDGSASAPAPHSCRRMWFVEPMAWMARVAREPQGKLLCPRCQAKLGSFSWVCGCKCPCGQKVAPAFYLVPSKVEWTNIVQNVQITV